MHHYLPHAHTFFFLQLGLHPIVILQSTVSSQPHGRFNSRSPFPLTLPIPPFSFPLSFTPSSPPPFSPAEVPSSAAPAALALMRLLRRPPSPTAAAPPASLRRPDGRLSSDAGSAAARGTGCAVERRTRAGPRRRSGRTARDEEAVRRLSGKWFFLFFGCKIFSTKYFI